MSSRIAIITGPPGVGKTAIARSIAMSIPACHIEEDVLYDIFPSIERSFASVEIVPELIVSLVKASSVRRMPMIIEGMFYDPNSIKKLCEKLDIACVIELTASVENCIYRNSRRAPGGVALPAKELKMLYSSRPSGLWDQVSANEGFEQVLHRVAEKLKGAQWPT